MNWLKECLIYFGIMKPPQSLNLDALDAWWSSLSDEKRADFRHDLPHVSAVVERAILKHRDMK